MEFGNCVHSFFIFSLFAVLQTVFYVGNMFPIIAVLTITYVVLICAYIYASYYMTNIFVMIVSERKLCYSFQANHRENKDGVPQGVCKVREMYER